MKRNITSSKRQLGQGMTEYIIIVALVAIGAFGAYNMFGKTVRQEVAAVALGLSGQDGTTEGTNAQTSATQSQTDADRAKSTNNASLDTLAH
jgi:Tfp pilus assembly protein PilV